MKDDLPTKHPSGAWSRRDYVREYDNLARQNAALCKFINTEMKMSAGDPRLEKLKQLTEES
jgi:hypothetical protein